MGQSVWEQEQGFSLMELLLALHLLGLMLLLFLPQLKEPYEDWQLRRFLSQLERDLQTLPLLAWSERDTFELLFFPRHYQVLNWRSGLRHEVEYPPRVQRLTLHYDPSNLRIRFTPRGTTSHGGTLCVETTGGTAYGFVFTLDTGKVRSQDGCP